MDGTGTPSWLLEIREYWSRLGAGDFQGDEGTGVCASAAEPDLPTASPSLRLVWSRRWRAGRAATAVEPFGSSEL